MCVSVSLDSYTPVSGCGTTSCRRLQIRLYYSLRVEGVIRDIFCLYAVRLQHRDRRLTLAFVMCVTRILPLSDAVAKFRIATDSFVMSICPSCLH